MRSSTQNIFIENVDRIVDNPLAHWLPSEIRKYARQFAKDHDLDPLSDLFVKVCSHGYPLAPRSNTPQAGLILKDPKAWPFVPGLNDADKAALEADNRPRRHIRTSLAGNSFVSWRWWQALRDVAFQSNGFWQQPKQLKSTTITLCVAAVAQGWCQAGSNGANLNWGQALLPESYTRGADCDPSTHWAWRFALVNAAPYLSASLALSRVLIVDDDSLLTNGTVDAGCPTLSRSDSWAGECL